jgi:NOL1/NOP2/fmu family ribosome biogenesis protein
MNVRFIKSNEKRDITQALNEQFGLTELPFLLIESGKEKIRGFTGHMSKDEMVELSKLANIEIVGLYIIKREADLRLSLDATHLLSKQLTKNIIDINDEQYQQWIRGHDLDIKTEESGTVLIRYNSDFIGCGKSNKEKIFNYVPKDRRLRK